MQSRLSTKSQTTNDSPLATKKSGHSLSSRSNSLGGIQLLQKSMDARTFEMTPSQIMQLQKTMGNRAVGHWLESVTSQTAYVKLQEKSAAADRNDSIHSPESGNVVQRLNIYPLINNGNDSDFNAAPRHVNVEDVTYQELCVYMAKRQQQLRAVASGMAREEMPRKGLPERNLVFEEDELMNMMVLIKAYEEGTGGLEAVPTVVCSEGQIKVASAQQAGNFGGVSSCMTITVVMEDGRKVLAHAGVEAPVTFASIKEIVKQIGGTVKTVVAAGVGWAWGVELDPYAQKSDSIEDHEEAFKGKLAQEIGGNAQYKELEGTIHVSQQGEVSA